MDASQAEFTDKIRIAIKKKLTEINAYIDDELPEYIMILVANKRSKVHIEKDLSLFLGTNTSEFTNWLCDLINNLQGGQNVISASESPKIGKKKNEINSDVEESDVLALDPQEQEEDFLCQEEIHNEQLNAHSISQIKPNALKKAKIATLKKELPLKKIMHPPKSAKVYPIQKINRNPPCSSVVSIKNSSINAHANEYDPLNPAVGSVSSVIHVTPRKHNVPEALQANKLLLRAIDDATKSVLGGKDISEFYKPTPIKALHSTDNSILNSVDKQENLNREFEICSQNLNSDIPIAFNSEDIVMEDLSYSDVSLPTIFAKEHRSISEKPQRHIILPPNNSSPEVSSQTNFSSKLAKLLEEKQELLNTEPQISPQFIVTLKGVNLETLKRKRPLEDNETLDLEDKDNEGMLLEEAVFTLSPEKKQKLKEKCKYWPACKSGDQCTYHHPTITCKLFPECKYGDKCLYIHPNCKFDALCSRKDCPFTHASKRKLPPSIPVPMIPMKSKKVKIVCKYFPNCFSRKCPYFHPKPCRYGQACQSYKCSYNHLPTRDQLKWSANS